MKNVLFTLLTLFLLLSTNGCELIGVDKCKDEEIPQRNLRVTLAIRNLTSLNLHLRIYASKKYCDGKVSSAPTMKAYVGANTYTNVAIYSFKIDNYYDQVRFEVFGEDKLGRTSLSSGHFSYGNIGDVTDYTFLVNIKPTDF